MVCEEESATYIMDCPLGEYALLVCPKGLHSVKQLILNNEEFDPDMDKDVKMKSEEIDPRFNRVVQEIVRWFAVYFDDPRHIEICGLPVICGDSVGSGFNANVWWAVAYNVQAGDIITYGELATLLGRRG